MAQDRETPNNDTNSTDHEQQPVNPNQVNSELAQAFQELAKGERTASALENKLDDIESRIEELLASAERNAAEQTQSGNSGNDGPAQPKPK